MKLFFLFLLIFLFILFFNNFENKEENQIIVSFDSDVDFYIKKPEIKSFNSNGFLKYFLKADDISHLTIKDEIIARNPKLEAYQDGIILYKADAQLGVLNADQTILNLINKVHLNDFDSNKLILNLLETEYLTILLKNSQIETYEFVTINNNNYNKSSTGLKADLVLGKYDFLSNVKFQYINK